MGGSDGALGVRIVLIGVYDGEGEWLMLGKWHSLEYLVWHMGVWGVG